MVFQRVVKAGGGIDKPDEEAKPGQPGNGEGQEPVSGMARVRQKLGIDANRPIDPSSGIIEPQVVDPAVIAASGVGWVRLNFVMRPWRGPDDPTRFSGRSNATSPSN